MKKHAWAAGFAACLTAFTVFLAMDTFVLSSVYQADATQINTEMIRQAEERMQASAAAEEAEKDASGETGSEETGSESESGGGEKNGASGESDGREHRKKPGSGGGKGPGSGNSGEKTAGSDQAESETSGSESPGEKTAGSDQAESEGSGSRPKKRRSSEGRSGVRDSGDTPSISRSGKSASSSTSRAGKTGSSSFNAEEAAQEAAAVTTDNAGTTNTYQDDNITIRYTEYETNGTTVHVADVQLSSAGFLKTAFAEGTYGKNVTQTTSEMAESLGAVLAINGDYYGVQERGYVIRNGVLYREEAGTSDVLCIYADGSMKIVDPSTVTAKELLEQGVWQAFSFGPGLVEDGNIAVSLDEEVGRAKASNPRTAIGIIDDLHYVFVVSDGRSDDSEGLSLYELASFMEQLGVQTAYNLDGGGSSTMVFQGKVVNDPAGGFGDREREVSDIVYIG